MYLRMFFPDQAKTVNSFGRFVHLGSNCRDFESPTDSLCQLLGVLTFCKGGLDIYIYIQSPSFIIWINSLRHQSQLQNDDRTGSWPCCAEGPGWGAPRGAQPREPWEVEFGLHRSVEMKT